MESLELNTTQSEEACAGKGVNSFCLVSVKGQQGTQMNADGLHSSLILNEDHSTTQVSHLLSSAVNQALDSPAHNEGKDFY